MTGGTSLTEHLVHWHRSCIKSFTYPYSEDQSFSTLTVATQYNDSSRSAVRMHQVCPFPAAQVQPAADGAWPWSVQLSKVMAHRFMFEHVGRIPSGTAVKNNKVMASGGWRGLNELPVSVPIFLNPQGRKETSLVSSRCVQHTPAMSCAIQATAALPQVGNSLWKCFIGSEIVASAAVGVAEESVISDRERPLSSKELLILPFLVVQYFLSFPSPVKYTLYSSGCQASAWQLCAACLATRKEALERELSAATAPICSTQALCSTAPHPSLLSPSINGSGSWEPWLIHHSAPYFPSGQRQENNIFFLPFHPFRARCIGSFFFCCPWVRVFLTNLLWAIAGLLGVFRAELTPAMPATHPGRLPNQWSIITCWWRWRMPGPLAVTILGPGNCVPSLSRHMLTSSSVHLQTGSNVPHSQLGGIQGQEGPSAISGWQLLPSFCPFPNIPSFPYPLLIWGTGKEYNTLWCLKHHCFRHKLKAWHPMRCCEENQPHPHQTWCTPVCADKAGHPGHPGRPKAPAADLPTPGGWCTEQCWVLEQGSAQVHSSCCASPQSGMPCKEGAG